MTYSIRFQIRHIASFISTLLVLVILVNPSRAQNTLYLKEDFSAAKKPQDWVLDSAGSPVKAGTCQDHKRIFSFNCQNLPPAHSYLDAKGFSGNIATIDLKNVGGATTAADSLYCLVTDTVNTQSSTNLKLAFDWQHASAGTKGTFRVQVWDGQQWQTVFVQNPDGNGRAELFIEKYSNPELRVRFCFSTDGRVTSHMDGAAVDNITLANVTCPAPAALALTSVKSHEASLRWQSPNQQAQSYLLSATGPNGRTRTLSSTSATMTGLMADTTYQTTVRAICQNGDTSLPAKGPDFHTWVQPKTVPYAENFDGATPEHGSARFGRRLGWLAKSQSTSRIRLVGLANQHEPDTPPSAPNKVRFSYAGLDEPDKHYLISPPLQGLGSQQNRLRLQATYDDTKAGLIVGVLANPRKPGQIRILDTLRPRLPQLTDSWKSYTVDLDDPAVPTNARHVVLANLKDHTRTFIDNIRYNPIPDCRKPQNLRVGKLSTDSAVLKWNAPNSAGEWLVTYGKGSFDPAKGGQTVSVNQPTAVLNGLASNQPYTAYVQAVCGNGDTSAYSYRTTFQTLCSPFQAFYQEGFDGPPIEHGEDFGDRRFCWRTLTRESHEIQLNAVGAKSDAKHNNSVEIAYRQNLYHEPNDDPRPLLISPKLTDLPTLKRGISLDVAFDADDTKLYAGVMKDPDDRGTFTILDTLEPKPGQPNHEYRRFYLPLNDGAVIQDQTHVAFTAVDSFVWTYLDGVSIDNIRYQKLPFCRTPYQFRTKKVRSTSADLSWQSKGTAGKWLVKVDTPGFDPDQGGKAYTFSRTNGTVNNLKPNTRYQAFVRGICSNADSSIYKQHVTFKTNCQTPPAVLPYREGFDSFEGTYLKKARFCKSPAQWQFRSDNHQGRLRFADVANNAKQPEKAATLDSRYSHSLSANDWILTLNMDNYSTRKPYLLAFDYRSYGGQDRPNDQVWIRGNKNNSWIKVYELLNNTGGGYQQVGPINLSKYLRNNFQVFTESFQVRFGQQGYYEAEGHPSAGRSFDNIHITRVQQDLAIIAMAEPAQACGMTDQEQLSVIIENSGQEPIPANTSVEMQYSMNDRIFSPKSITTDKQLGPGDTLHMTFPTTMAMDAQDTAYHMKAWLNWADDQLKGNDTMTKVIEVPDPRHRADHVLDSSAMLKWNNTANTKKTRVVWGAKHFNPSKSGKRLRTAKANHRISNLQPGKTYEVYTQEVCRNNDTGTLRGPMTFTTRTDARDLRALDVSRAAGRGASSCDAPVAVQFMNYGYDAIPAGTALTLSYQLKSKDPVKKAVQLESKLGPTDTVTRVLDKPLMQADVVQGQINKLRASVTWQPDQNPDNNHVTRALYIAERPDKPTVQDITICQGENAVLSARSQADKLDWYTITGEALLGFNDKAVVDPSEDQTYYVRAYNHRDSCPSPYAYVKVTVHDKPEVSFTADTVCAEKPVVLEGQASVTEGTISRYTWKAKGLSTQNRREAKISFPHHGIYKVRFQATSDEGCQADISKNVKVKPRLTPHFNLRRIKRKRVQFVGDEKATRYKWNLGDGTTRQAQQFRHTYAQPGEYQVQLKAATGEGCWSTNQETITIQPPDEGGIEVYPNPVSLVEPLTLTYTLPAKQDVQIQLLTMDGRQPYNRTLANQAPGTHTLELPMQGKAGVYLLKVQTKRQTYERKVVVVR